MMPEGYIALVLGVGIAAYAVRGISEFIAETWQMYRSGTAEVRQYKQALRSNIHQLAEAIAEEDPEEMSDPMLREALHASIAEYRNL
jgi:Na+-transporting methylmalonyl-CoA/oxaloacetate decarboxylase gamma subunit